MGGVSNVSLRCVLVCLLSACVCGLGGDDARAQGLVMFSDVISQGFRDAPVDAHEGSPPISLSQGVLGAATPPSGLQVQGALTSWTTPAPPSSRSRERTDEDRENAMSPPRPDSSRAATWRQMRLQKATDMEPPDPSLVAQVVSFVERNRGYVLPDRLLLDIPSIDLFGIQPVLGGMNGASGASGGLWYSIPSLNGPRRHGHLQVLGSLRRYWSVEAIAGLRRDRWLGYAYARHNHLPTESFYGVGPATSEDRRSFYRLDESIAGILAGRMLGDRVLVGGHSSYRRDFVGAALHVDGSETDATSSQLDAGAASIDHLVTGVFAEFDARDASYDRTYGQRFAPTEARLRGISLDATRGVYLAASLSHHQDVIDRDYSYTRLTLDAQQYLPLRHGMQRGLAFRQYLSLSQSPPGQDVPFHRLPSIGGPHSLRGFTGGRFSDWNAAITSVEMRCRVWHRLDMALFSDAGQVFREAGELAIEEIQVGYGVGFRFRSDQGVIARFEVSRSVEGFSTYLKFGSIL